MDLDAALVSTRTRLDELSVGVVCASADGRMVAANRRIRQMVGPVPAGVPGSHWATRFGLARGDGRPYARTGEIPVLRALAEGDVRTRMTSRDGSGSVLLSAVATPVVTPSGRCIGSVGLFRPIRSAATPVGPAGPVAGGPAVAAVTTEDHALLLVAALHFARTTPPRDRLAPHQQVLDLLQDRYQEPWTLQSLAGELLVSANHLTSAVSAATGRGAMRLLAERRVAEAGRLLADPGLSVAQVGAAVGLPDTERFTRTFHRYTGMSPSAWRRRSGGTAGSA